MPGKNNYKLFSQKRLLQYSLIISISIILFFLFVFGEVLILKQSTSPQLFHIDGVSPARWEEVVCYLPFFKSTGPENIWPDQPHVNANSTGVSHIPFITNLFGAGIYHIICQGNNNAFMLITHGLFPAFCFWLLYLIFRLHLGVSWSALLAFFSISYHSSYSFLKNSLITMAGSAPFIPPSAPPEMSRFPFPALSMLFFLIPFYLTLRSRGLKKSNREIFLLSLLWALQIHIYIYNFIAGIIFFTLWLFYHHYFACRHRKTSLIRPQLLFLFCSTLIIAAPYLTKLYRLSESGLIPHLSGQSPEGLQFSNWGFFAAYALPVCLLMLAVYAQRADIFEFFYRFTPIFLIFATDLSIGLLCWLSNGLLGAELHYHRISNIAFRFLWFVPLLYFISAPEKPLRRPAQTVLQTYRRHIRSIAVLLHKFRTLLAVGGILTTAVFLLCGGYAAYYNHEVNVVPVTHSASQKTQILQNLTPGTVFWENPADNLLTPVISSHSSIIAHSFSNLLPKDLLIERLVLYTKIFNWDETRFLHFMLPGGKFSRLTSFAPHQTKISAADLLNGFGFWCVYHRQKINPTELKAYRMKIMELYNSLNPVTALEKMRKNNSIHIISTQIPAVAAEISPLELTKSGEYFIFTIETKNK